MDERSQFDETIEGLQAALHVGHVAASPLLWTPAQEPVRVVRSWAKQAGINNVPVEAEGVIVGVLENVSGDLEDAPQPADDQRAGQAMRRLALLESTARLDRVFEVLLKPPYCCETAAWTASSPPRISTSSLYESWRSRCWRISRP
jgi:hypothetical protein